jgi:hypothetical protein
LLPSFDGSGATSHCSFFSAASGRVEGGDVGEPQPDHRRLAAPEEVHHIRALVELQRGLRQDLVLVDEVEDLLHAVDAGCALVHDDLELVVHEVAAVAPEELHPVDDAALALVELHREADDVCRLGLLRGIQQLIVSLRRLQPLASRRSLR